MAIWGFGLRAKSMLALLLACLLALLPAALVGWQVVEQVRQHFGEAYVRNFTQLNRQNILAPVSRDLALALRLADSEVTRQWLLEEANPDKQALFFREAEGYRRDFRDNSYFVISDLSRNYYFNAADKAFSAQPRYVLDPLNPDDSWYFNTLEASELYNINVNPDVQLRTTRVWLNVIVRDDERKIGLAGTGLDLGGFLRNFIAVDEPGVTPMILAADGAIQAHPDESLIAYGAVAGDDSRGSTLAALLPEAERAALAQAMARASAAPETVATLRVRLDGREQLLALSYLPELRWHVATAVDLRQARVLEGTWLRAAGGALLMLLAVLFAGFAYAVDRLVLRPVRTLQQSATALAEGDYAVSLPAPRRDELGDLSRAFAVMAAKIRAHLEELEDRVRARTRELESANLEMAAAQKQISDSIDYASLIQRAFLPDRQMAQLLGEHHFVLWRPRHVVGGDFYVFRAEGDSYLAGVVDCAGHGVPGALMTMLARAATDHAIHQVGMESPAAILSHADTALRAMLADSELPRAIATNMDMGLVCIDRAQRRLRFAGAKISLYWSDGEQIGELKGERRALMERRVGTYSDTEIPLVSGQTYYLATDGYLDQAGGELGYGLGRSRFSTLLCEHARKPMKEQAAALDRALREYQGDFPQRDDITILSFRID